MNLGRYFGHNDPDGVRRDRGFVFFGGSILLVRIVGLECSPETGGASETPPNPETLELTWKTV